MATLWFKATMASRSVLGDRVADGDVPVAARLLKTPIGVLQVAASQEHLLYVQLPPLRAGRGVERWLRDRLMISPPTPPLLAALDQLREYFAGKRRAFDVPLQPHGTDFQRQVWQRVAAIRFGETEAYGRIAAGLGGRRVARAVGAAVGANPIPILIPCHRVIGADGSLTGYGGGLRRKIWLLQHEGVLLA